jgi:hypothetical protein
LERAAREFDPTPAEQEVHDEPAQEPAAAHSLSVLPGLSGQTVNRDYAI